MLHLAAVLLLLSSCGHLGHHHETYPLEGVISAPHR